jgi:hypothetical protein
MKFAKAFVNVSGNKRFPFVAMTAGGICLGYAKDSKTAGAMCEAYLSA